MNQKPLVGIVMGSESDLEIMNEAFDFLQLNKIPSEMKIVSAHRTPEIMLNYAKNAKKRGLKVIIAGAGGSAHLPGMVASLTTLPVIGVPIKTQNLNGLDSLLSIVQMPKGIPVACVAINGSLNAAILSCQILGIRSGDLEANIQEYRKSMYKEVIKKSSRLKNFYHKKIVESLKDDKKSSNFLESLSKYKH